MSTVLMILIAAAALMTLYVLVRGVIGMAQGKDLSGQRSQALMRQRVMFQAVAVVLVILFIMVARGSGS